MDEVFQNETRFPGGDWKPASEPFTDVVRTQFSFRLDKQKYRGINVTIHVNCSLTQMPGIENNPTLLI